MATATRTTQTCRNIMNGQWVDSSELDCVTINFCAEFKSVYIDYSARKQ